MADNDADEEDETAAIGMLCNWLHITTTIAYIMFVSYNGAT